MRKHFRTITEAAVVAGTLDILSAFVFAGIGGMRPAAVLNYVASGPFGDVALHGGGWVAVGLAVHFTIMACFATAYVMIRPKISALTRRPAMTGLIFGLLIWIFMYWVVKPLRWPDAPLPHSLYGIANALFSHCILVGLPIALIAGKRGRATAPSHQRVDDPAVDAQRRSGGGGGLR